jgi:hypothetical protein
MRDPNRAPPVSGPVTDTPVDTAATQQRTQPRTQPTDRSESHKPKATARRTRWIHSDNRLMEIYLNLIDKPEMRDRIYIYRLRDEIPEKPALFVGEPFSWVEDFLQTEHGGGEFLIMIRRGERMMLSGCIAIAPLPIKRF